MPQDNYIENLKIKMDAFVHVVYRLSKNFPKEEIYGATSQIRRAVLSIILNFIEGYARKKTAVKRNFWETSYGSLKEVKYLLYFALKEDYINQIDYKNTIKLAEEIAAMLWRALEPLYEENI